MDTGERWKALGSNWGLRHVEGVQLHRSSWTKRPRRAKLLIERWFVSKKKSWVTKKHELRHEKIAANNSCTTFLLPSYLCSLNGSTEGLGSSHGSLQKQNPAVAWMNSSLKPLGLSLMGPFPSSSYLKWMISVGKVFGQDFCCKMGCVPNARNRFLTSQESLGSKFCLGVFQFTFAGTTSGKKYGKPGWFNRLSGSRSQKLLV